MKAIPPEEVAKLKKRDKIQIKYEQNEISISSNLLLFIFPSCPILSPWFPIILCVWVVTCRESSLFHCLFVSIWWILQTQVLVENFRWNFWESCSLEKHFKARSEIVLSDGIHTGSRAPIQQDLREWRFFELSPCVSDTAIFRGVFFRKWVSDFCRGDAYRGGIFRGLGRVFFGWVRFRGSEEKNVEEATPFWGWNEGRIECEQFSHSPLM